MAESSTQVKRFQAALRYCYTHSDFGSQDALAVSAGVGRSTLNEQLKGKKGSSAKLQTKLAAAFGYDLLDFLSLGKSLLEGADSKKIKPPKVATKKVIPFSNLKPSEKEILELTLEVLRSEEPAVGGVRGALATTIKAYASSLPPPGRARSPAEAGVRRAGKDK